LSSCSSLLCVFLLFSFVLLFSLVCRLVKVQQLIRLVYFLGGRMVPHSLSSLSIPTSP
jgi:hypothetical protein